MGDKVHALKVAHIFKTFRAKRSLAAAFGFD